MRTLTTIAMLAAFSAVSSAASPDEEVRQAEKRWAAAVLAADTAALERMLSDGLIYAHSTGVIDTKSDYLVKLRSGRQKYTAIEQESLVIKIHGNAAVAHSRTHMMGTNPKGAFDDRLMMLHLWIRAGNEWRLAAHQTTKLP